jgi:hypothetical protein
MSGVLSSVEPLGAVTVGVDGAPWSIRSVTARSGVWFPAASRAEYSSVWAPSPEIVFARPRMNGPPSTRETTSCTPDRSSKTKKRTVSGPRCQAESFGTGVITGGCLSTGLRPTLIEQNALPRRPPTRALLVRTTPDATVREPRTQR